MRFGLSKIRKKVVYREFFFEIASNADFGNILTGKTQLWKGTRTQNLNDAGIPSIDTSQETL
jgi:hypothetical protein